MKLFKQDTMSDTITNCLRTIAISGSILKKVPECEQATVSQMMDVVKQTWQRLAD
jgi:hypothetical protein